MWQSTFATSHNLLILGICMNSKLARPLKESRKKFSTRKLIPYLFLSPTMIGITLGFFYPMLKAIWQSFFDNPFGKDTGNFVGFDNFQILFDSTRFWSTLKVSAIFTTGSIFGVLVIGFLTAMLLNQSFFGRGIIRSLYIIPWAIPYVTASMIWKWMFDYQFGVINFSLQKLPFFTGSIDWLNSSNLALISVLVVSTWKLYPLGTVMYLAGLQSVSPELYEAAEVDGASFVQRVVNITIPGVRKVTTVLLLLVGIWSFGRAFTAIYLITGGGPVGATENVVLYTYNLAFQFFKSNQASALGTIVLLISGVFAMLYINLISKE